MGDTQAAADSAPSPGEFSLGDVLADIAADAQATDGSSEEEGGTAGGEPEEEQKPAPKGKAGKAAPVQAKPEKPGKGKAEPEKPETSKERDRRHGEGRLRDDLSDERPWTPQRIKDAVEDAKGLQRHAQRMWATEQARAEKLGVQRNEVLREKERLRVDREHFDAQARLINSRLQSSDPNEMLTALGLLFGRDGATVLEELNVSLARGGKKRELSRLEREQAERLAALERKEQEREQQAQRAREDAAIAQRKTELADLVMSNAEEFPELSTYAAEDIGDALADIKTRRYNAGTPVSDVQAARLLEKDLQRRQREREARAGAPEGASGLAPRGSQQPKPGQAQSSPPQRGRSLTQSSTRERVSTRELEDDESSEDAADFLPASLLDAAKPQRW